MGFTNPFGSPGRSKAGKSEDRPGQGAQRGVGAASLNAPGALEREASVDLDPVVAPAGVSGSTVEAIKYLGRLLNSSLSKYLLFKWEERIRQIVQHVRLPSHIDPPLAAVYFDLSTAASVSVPNDGVWTTVASKTFDQNERAVVHWIGQQVNTPGAFSFISWRILIDGQPVEEFNAWTGQIGSLVNPAKVMIHIPIGAKTLKLQAKHSHSGESFTAKATVRGYRYVPFYANRNGMIGTLADVE